MCSFLILRVDGRENISCFRKGEYSWLRYCDSEGSKGGWCIHCVLFLTDIDKSTLATFVTKPFINYNKSKEKCENMPKRYTICEPLTKRTNLNRHITTQSKELIDISSQNYKFNSKVLPLIVEAVISCARQKIALQGHQQDKIYFAIPPVHNEVRLLAKAIVLTLKNTLYLAQEMLNT